MRRMCGSTAGSSTRPRIFLSVARRGHFLSKSRGSTTAETMVRSDCPFAGLRSDVTLRAERPPRAFTELQERGFIELVTKGAFSRKVTHASEWRITFWTCDVTGDLPSKKFMSWDREKQNAVSKYPVAVSWNQRAA